MCQLSYNQICKRFKEQEEKGGRWWVNVKLRNGEDFRRAYICSLEHALEIFSDNAEFLETSCHLSLREIGDDGIFVMLTMEM